MTYILVQVVLFSLLYLVVRSIANRLGTRHHLERPPARGAPRAEGQSAYGRVESDLRKRTVRAWEEQQAEVTRVQARQDEEVRRVEAEMARRVGAEMVRCRTDNPVEQEWW